jgi:putative holin Dp-1
MLFTGPVYDVLKKLAQVWLPALGTLYFAVGQIWGLPSTEEVVGTIMAVDTFLGLCLGISTKTYNDTDARFDGHVVIEEHDGESTMRLKSVDVKALDTKDELRLKITR